MSTLTEALEALSADVRAVLTRLDAFVSTGKPAADVGAVGSVAIDYEARIGYGPKAAAGADPWGDGWPFAEGPQGPAGTITDVTVSTGPAGSNASIVLGGTPSARTFALTLPRGDQGAPGVAATITEVTVATGAAGSNASLVLGGTPSARSFALTLPRGDQGAPGVNGWTPIEGNVPDGARVVKRVVDWVGGTGAKPTAGKYVGASGLVDTAAEATDVRGPGGAGSGDMVAANNLSELTDVAAARTKLDVYSKAQIDTSLGGKADLVGGQVPAAQLPTIPAKAGASDLRVLSDDAKFLTAKSVADAAAYVALADAATVAVDLSTGTNFTLLTTSAIGINRVLGAPTNGKPGVTYSIEGTTDAANRTMAYASAFKFPGGTVPSIPTTAGARWRLQLQMNAAGTFDAVMLKDMK